MAFVETHDPISIANASRLRVSALVREAETGKDHIVPRNNQPVAAVVGIARLEQWQRTEDDLLGVSLVAARMATTGPERSSLDEVLTEFGFTRDQ